MGLSLPEQYIDFSANINPLGPPHVLKEKWNDFFDEIKVYPDPYAARLKDRIAIMENLSTDSILIGNGGAELINLVARLLAGKKVLLLQPTFSEYEKACRANQCEILYHQLVEPRFELNPTEISEYLGEVDALFLCNPNNPTGIHYPRSTVISIIEECKKQNCLVILDEAFYDFLVEYDSFIPYVNRNSHVIIIRSMTKMFAIPGIRLGYLVAPPNLAVKLRQFQSQWNINSIALTAGELCLQNEAFIHETQKYIHDERKRLFKFYQQEGFLVSSSQINFYLLRDPLINNQFDLFNFLLRQGIIPRHTYNFSGLEGRWLRFAIKSYEENNRLKEVLIQWRNYLH
jgi:threonine-phosphate decarboxylase